MLNKQVLYCHTMPYPNATRVERQQYQMSSWIEFIEFISRSGHRVQKVLNKSEIKPLFTEVSDEVLNSGKYKSTIQGFPESCPDECTTRAFFRWYVANPAQRVGTQG